MANRPGIVDQTYSWSGGIVNHGRGTKADYKITWFDSKGPTILHPEYNDPYVARFCNSMMITNYEGDAEPTRQKKNGQTENCVTFVFLPRLFTRGQICMADDYCSIEMTYICELSKNQLIKQMINICFFSFDSRSNNCRALRNRSV
jgi:hypothetical protein